jgi:WD repeat and SOF domain-containing protein 1
MNIRMWKTKASQPIGHINKRHENSLNYRETLKEKFGQVKEIKRMARHRHLPKYILNNKLKKQD